MTKNTWGGPVSNNVLGSPRKGKEMILQEHHIKCGLRTQEDDHVITLYHGNEVIARWSIEGILSKDEILREADKFIARKLNPTIGDRLAKAGRYGR